MSNLSFLFHFLIKIKIENRKAPDGKPRFMASNLGLFCLPMSDKNDARLIWVNGVLQNLHVYQEAFVL